MTTNEMPDVIYITPGDYKSGDYPATDTELPGDIKYLRSTPALEAALVGWRDIESAPRDWTEFLVRLPRQGNVILLVSYNKIHKHWQSKGSYISLHEGDLWTHIPTWETPPKGE